MKIRRNLRSGSTPARPGATFVTSAYCKGMSTPTDRAAWVHAALRPFAVQHQLAWLPRQQQYRRTTPTGFRALIVSLSHYATDSVLELHLALRHDLIETTAFRYTNGLSAFAPDSLTLVASSAKLRGVAFDRYVIRQPEDVQRASAVLLPWLAANAEAFWDKYAELRAVDVALNAEPTTNTLLMPNQQLRCLRGLVAARYAQRPNWEVLIPLYRQRLVELYATEPIRYGYERLVDFLRTYTPN